MATVVRTALMRDGGVELVYTATDGQYVGRIRVEAVTEGAMGIMAEDFAEFLAEQKAEAEKPRIALAVNNAVKGAN
jgi:hypothetical protein